MKEKIETTGETFSETAKKKREKTPSVPLQKGGGQRIKTPSVPLREGGGNKKEAIKKKKKYKIDYKKLVILAGGAILLIGIVGGGIWFFKKQAEKKGEVKIYDVLVQLKDQKSSNLEEDAQNSAKAGDVILVRETGGEWSKTERISYLILKMKLDEKQAQKIVQPKTEKLSKDEALEKGVVQEEQLKDMEKEELKMMLVETVLFREYRVKIEELEFDLMKVREKQPFEEEEFGWEIVEKK